MSTRPQLFNPNYSAELSKPILTASCSHLCGICKWTMFCHEYWRNNMKNYRIPKDRKYYTGSPIKSHQRR